jgi:hypothetical protein
MQASQINFLLHLELFLKETDLFNLDQKDRLVLLAVMFAQRSLELGRQEHQIDF